MWNAYAHQFENGRFHTIGPKDYVKLHMLSGPIFPVQVEVDEKGDYWGWQYTGKEAELPRMIWPTEIQFKMCFAYGPQVEVDAGKGRIVRLKVSKK